MRFIFTNLHCNSFIIKPLSYFIYKKPCTYKNKNILNYLYNNNRRIYVYINCRSSSFGGILGEVILKNRVLIFLEFFLTVKLNGYNLSQFKVIFNKKKLTENDILLTYIFFPNDLYEIEQICSYKVVDFNHFHCEMENINKLKYIDCVTSVSNNFDSPPLVEIIKRWSNFKTVIKPYAYQDRFQSIKKYSERIRKAAAMGTLVYMDKNLFRKFINIYHSNCLHPMREEIYKNRDSIEDYIDSKISLYIEDESNNFSNTIIGHLHSWYNSITNKNGRQKTYFSFNLVEFYNNYAMAVIPEEITDMPAMGFVEAMACGCAYIGIDSKIYKDIGLVPGKHYIAYNGTLPDLIKKIAYYQEPSHYNELYKIASEGYRFVTENLNEEKVAKNFFQQISKAYRSRSMSGHLKL